MDGETHLKLDSKKSAEEDMKTDPEEHPILNPGPENNEEHVYDNTLNSPKELRDIMQLLMNQMASIKEEIKELKESKKPNFIEPEQEEPEPKFIARSIMANSSADTRKRFVRKTQEAKIKSNGQDPENAEFLTPQRTPEALKNFATLPSVSQRRTSFQIDEKDGNEFNRFGLEQHIYLASPDESRYSTSGAEKTIGQCL